VVFPSDAGLVSVLLHLGVHPEGLLGHGGEAWVYSLDERHVVRVLHEGGTRDQLHRNQELVEEISAHLPRIALPCVLEVGEWNGRIYSIERRLPGSSVLESLDSVSGSARDRLIEAHLEAAASLSEAQLGARDYFGDLAEAEPVRAPTWRSYLEAKAKANLAAGGFSAQIDASQLAEALPEPDIVGFVHLDAFAGNMMTDGERITAVLDIGPSCVRGDTRFNALAAVVYLEAPVTTPNATLRDRQVALNWVDAQGFRDLLEPVRAWLASYWSFEVDNPKIRSWVRSVLASTQSSTPPLTTLP
jgi:aminoglycoside phosphotransferase (APT) family kinase protein